MADEPTLVAGVDKQAGGNWYRGSIGFRDCGLSPVIHGVKYIADIGCPHAHRKEPRAQACAEKILARIMRAKQVDK